MTIASDEQIVTPVEARSELLRVLASPDFTASRQLSSFLRYIVEESLAGHAQNLKERTVARGALNRGTSFDPRLDCVVRVVAGKLRRSLERYYSVQGASNTLCIQVPKGGYCPVFSRRSSASQTHNGSDAIAVVDSTNEGASRPIVAVSPLKLLTGGAKERFFADLLIDDVVVRLARLPEIEVIDCLATQSPRLRREDLRETALRLHANFIFGGTAGKIGFDLRISVRLVDGQSGVLVWGDQYDRSGESGPQPDDIADRIAIEISDCFARN